MIDQDFSSFTRLADVVGPIPALKIIAFYGHAHGKVHIPAKYTPGHQIERLVGGEALQKLVETFPGQTISVPDLDLLHLRRAGLVARMEKHGLPPSVIGLAVGITPRQVQRIQEKFRSGAPADDLLIDPPEDDQNA